MEAGQRHECSICQSVGMLEATVPTTTTTPAATPAVHDRLPHAAVPLPMSAVDLARPLKRRAVGEPAAAGRPRKHAAVAATPEEKAARPLMAREPPVQVGSSKAGAGRNRGVECQRQPVAPVPLPIHFNDMEMEQQRRSPWTNDQQMKRARAYHWIASNVPPRFLKPMQAGPAQPGNSLSPAAFECLYANLAKVEVLEQMGTSRQVGGTGADFDRMCQLAAITGHTVLSLLPLSEMTEVALSRLLPLAGLPWIDASFSCLGRAGAALDGLRVMSVSRYCE
jgi:hypothetical protein